MATPGWMRIVLVGAVMLGASCTAAPRQRPLPIGAVNLQGRWSLVSMELFPPNEAAIHVVGSGQLVYDDFANLTVDLRVDEATARLFERIGISAPNGVISTSGRTLVDMTSRTLSYTLEGQQAVRPATHPLDTNRPRYWEVDGNTLTLRTKDDTGKVISVAVWRKE
jgi:hypothetical protein